MKARHVHTRRLDLVPATGDILSADLHDHQILACMLVARVPAQWPPQEMNTEVLTEFLRMETEKTDPLFACWYWVLDDAKGAGRTLIGSGGIGSAFDDPGTVLMGYSVLDMFRNRGFATEAVQGTIPEVFSDSRISRIMATTFPELKASIRVLEKNGFSCTGPTKPGAGLEEGSLGFVLERQEYGKHHTRSPGS